MGLHRRDKLREEGKRRAAERREAPPPSAFAERLSRYTDQNVRPTLHTPAAPMPLWARERYWFLTPPKRTEVIRRMLLRIRRWVRRPRM